MFADHPKLIRGLQWAGLCAAFALLLYSTLPSCSDPDTAATPTTTSAPEGTAPRVTVPVDPSYSDPPTPAASRVPTAATQIATQYITAKENRDSYFQTSVRSWVDSITPITTPLARERWADLDPNGKPGAAWLWAHDKRVKTQVLDVLCVDNPEVPTPNPNKLLSVRCSWLAAPVYADGRRVSPNDIDFTWEYNGPRGPAVLSMVNNGGWKVSLDATGVAQ